MVKQVKKTRKKPVKKHAPISVPDWVYHILALFLFLSLSVIYFYPQFQGKQIFQSDIISWKAAADEIITYNETHREPTLWTNSMFSGMPAYFVSTRHPGNLMLKLEKVVNLFLERPAGYFIALMICFYLLGNFLKWHPLVSIIVALAFGFSTNHFILFEAGHTTKLRAIAFFSIIVIGVLQVFRKRYLIGGLLSAIGMAIEIGVNHIQMTYYLGLVLALFLLIELFQAFKNKSLKVFGKQILVLAFAGILAILANASQIWTTYEYSSDTMRGEPVLDHTGEDTYSSSGVKGLSWDYAMDWSNDYKELFSYIIPGFTGGSSQEPMKNAPALETYLFNLGQNIPDAPVYWGSLPFTSGPAYLGVIMFFIFLFGILTIKGNRKWWILGAFLLTIFISLGKNFEVFNRLLFDNLPLFNKFRTPNSIASITSFIVALMVGITLAELINNRKKYDQKELLQKLTIAFVVTGGVCLFFYLSGGSWFNFVRPEESVYPADLIEVLRSDRRRLLQSDSLRSFAFVAGAFIALLVIILKKVPPVIILPLLGALLLVDSWGIARRYLNDKSFERLDMIDRVLEPRDVDLQIMEDEEMYFRVLDRSTNTFNNAIPSKHYKTIGGYSAAKLQRYQDIIDYYLMEPYYPVLSMLNTKYIINENQEVELNRDAFGNAWVVSSHRIAATPNEEIEALRDMDLSVEAIVHRDFENYVSGLSSSGGTVRLSVYAPNRLEYEAEMDAEGLVVFSEVWYGPNKGWKAYLDGVSVDHIRVNYILRGIRVPEGAHTIVFEFKPGSYIAGTWISRLSSGLLGLLMILVILYEIPWIRDRFPDINLNFGPRVDDK
jgi:hypothetical protein